MIIYKNISGHHLEYSEIVSEIVKSDDIRNFKLAISIFKFLFIKNIFLVTIDNSFISFFIFSKVRSFLFLKTKGIVIRSTNLNGTSFKNRLKRYILQNMRADPSITLIAIVDNTYIHNFSNYFDLYIPDLMFYRSNMHCSSIPSLVSNPIINFVGFINTSKGKDKLKSVLEKNKDYILNHYGHFDNNIVNNFLHLENAIFHGKYKKSCEDFVFKNCKYVWCYFDSSYDLSSAAFCKSFKYSKIPVVREGGYLEFVCKKYNLTHATIINDEIIDVVTSFDSSEFHNHMSELVRTKLCSVYYE